MSNLTSELNLAMAVEDDDTDDYLVLNSGLAGSLNVVDGLFNSSTGHSHFGSHNGAPINPANFPDGSIPVAKLAPGLLEWVFANTWTNQAANYTVVSPIMFVFCTAAITVTLPAAASTNRPITVIAVAGQSAIASAGGSVIGGSVNTSSGAIMNGVASAGDSLTYKSDGTNWRGRVTALLASAAALVVDRNNWHASSDTWQANANTAYDSGVWGSGTHWHARFDAEVALYNDMLAQKNTWNSRADQAWGASRVWSNGESWEAAYNRVLPLNFHQLSVGLSNAALTGTFQVMGGALTLDRTGYWHVSWTNAMGSGSNDNSNWGYAELHNDSAGGAVLASNMCRFRGPGNNPGNYYINQFNNGTVIRLYARCSGDGNWSIDGAGQLTATFIPTPANPH